MRSLLPLLGSFLLAIACGCPQKTGSEAPPATQPTQPAPSQPAPSQPAPTQPAPSQPTPPAPVPSQPTPLPPPTQGQPTKPTQPTQGSGGTAAEPAPNWPKGTAGIGDNCGPNDTCGKGLTCVSYYGIAGPRGPQFKTCEIKCKADANCPAGHSCVTIADGPGQVCRK